MDIGHIGETRSRKVDGDPGRQIEADPGETGVRAGRQVRAGPGKGQEGRWEG